MFTLHCCLLRNGFNSFPLCGNMGWRWGGNNHFCKRHAEQEVCLSWGWQRLLQKDEEAGAVHGSQELKRVGAEQRLAFTL